jgi:GDPmannose 4,6-dehydratase
MSNQGKAIITGSGGQDGSFMAEYLLNNTNLDVVGTVRRTSQSILGNLDRVISNPRFRLANMDLNDVHSVTGLIATEKPNYFINLGASTFVPDSWNQPALVMQTNAVSLIHILEAIRHHAPTCRMYSAGTSEQVGDVLYSPQDIDHPRRSRSIYGASKNAAEQICKVYKESYGLYVTHGLLYNHESERRQDYFVTRKITKGVAQIKHALEKGGKFQPLELGNLEARRDWSHAEDFVQGIWRMLNQEIYNLNLKTQLEKFRVKSNDDRVEKFREGNIDYLVSRSIKNYVLASGEMHSIREFCELSFKEAGIEGIWRNIGKGPFKPEDEVYLRNTNVAIVDSNDKDILVKINPKFYRPSDVEELCGNAQPIKEELNWKPKISFRELVKRMVTKDIDLLK